MANLPHRPLALTWSALAVFFLAAVGLAQYKEHDPSTYGLVETVCGVVTIFSFLPDMFRQVQMVTDSGTGGKLPLEGVVGVIGGLYLISEGFSLILESAKNRIASKVARAG
jgi:hypothetical protein